MHEIGGSEPFKHPLSHYDLQEPVSGVFHDELSKWMLGKMGSNYLLLILWFFENNKVMFVAAGTQYRQEAERESVNQS